MIRVNSCVNKVEMIELRVNRYFCAARHQERSGGWGGGHVVSKFVRTLTMKTEIEDSMRTNMMTLFQILKTVS